MACSFFNDVGICVNITAANTNPHPINSFVESTSFKITHPASVANTDSKLIIIESTVGLFEIFWPTICNVYPIPLDTMPKYNIGNIF